ncbi:hypothetical protein [Oscillatoria sp. HE19RPO]|uniref:hypothetical protein n=1 Tax=Oscillatoria sp. HE19RPO TaxID=2954806 RepID=UPI0020C33783|nr:hypothetical protein [Oscillatoria sp. HE19RPO]
MLGNEPGRFLADYTYPNPEGGDPLIFEEYDCPWCDDGYWYFTDSDGIEQCEQCDECDGNGTITVRIR